MNKLTDEEMKEFFGGSITGSLWSAISKGFSIFSDMGRYLGSSIRRLINNNMCDF